jgi:hypothetical protein
MRYENLGKTFLQAFAMKRIHTHAGSALMALSVSAGVKMKLGVYWRPVRESNPCRRREREAIYGNSKETCVDSTVR